MAVQVRLEFGEAQQGAETGERFRTQRLGEDVGHLVRGAGVNQLEGALLILLAGKKVADFDVLEALAVLCAQNDVDTAAVVFMDRGGGILREAKSSGKGAEADESLHSAG
jgi:hypothetical protein